MIKQQRVTIGQACHYTPTIGTHTSLSGTRNDRYTQLTLNGTSKYRHTITTDSCMNNYDRYTRMHARMHTHTHGLHHRR